MSKGRGGVHTKLCYVHSVTTQVIHSQKGHLYGGLKIKGGHKGLWQDTFILESPRLFLAKCFTFNLEINFCLWISEVLELARFDLVRFSNWKSIFVQQVKLCSVGWATWLGLTPFQLLWSKLEQIFASQGAFINGRTSHKYKCKYKYKLQGAFIKGRTIYK